MRKSKRLEDAYSFPGFRLERKVHGQFGDPKRRITRLLRREKKTVCGACGQVHRHRFYYHKVRRIRDLSCGDARVYLHALDSIVSFKKCSFAGYKPATA
jgi:hypothetical protein